MHVVFTADGELQGDGFVAAVACTPTYKFSGELRAHAACRRPSSLGCVARSITQHGRFLTFFLAGVRFHTDVSRCAAVDERVECCPGQRRRLSQLPRR